MLLEDMHTHTNFSSDADTNNENSPSGKSEEAIKKGLNYIAFTDHYDIDPLRGINHDINTQIAAVSAAKSTYKNKITIIQGIELANSNEFPDKANEVIKNHFFDFILGSLHMNSGLEDFSLLNFSDKTLFSDKDIQNLYKDYLFELKQISKFADFDSLAHIGYPLRYFKIHARLGAINSADYTVDLKEIFKNLISRGKSLEINTSGLRQNHGSTFPDDETIKFYLSMGGRDLTLGSDSHDLSSIGNGILEVKNKLKTFGFTYSCIYLNRKKIKIGF